MLIGLLAVLGVDLIVLVAFAAFVFGRKRWVKREPGPFAASCGSPAGRSTAFARNGAVATGTGSATSSSGRRARSSSGTSSSPPTGWTSNALHVPMRSSGSATTPA